jgi:hypothetical protein
MDHLAVAAAAGSFNRTDFQMVAWQAHSNSEEQHSRSSNPEVELTGISKASVIKRGRVG